MIKKLISRFWQLMFTAQVVDKAELSSKYIRVMQEKRLFGTRTRKTKSKII